MLHRKEKTPMPPHVSEHDLANEFNHFFKQKIQTIQDPISTNLLRECIDEILPLLTKMINLSINLGDMPMLLKNAIITTRS